ncbi:TPA: acyltransferase family protein [Vibrio diabolicus]|uniref:acyltransferase family protein n=1 Tax=Vibrio diabolicus TaxID=50719 RepID=UPI0021603B6B|nr:acyltransferase family protein [Vibrio diabolicus]MCS0342732.1 acyltransferase [Vibrio diabolicus]
MNFRYDINGLRAIAVIAVVLFHFNPSWVPGGFAGVDVFFVISGFLMTGIIFRGLEKDNFSLFQFYVARANRIIPALAVLCIILLVFGWLYLTPSDYKVLGKHVASSISFLSNIVYWRESGYFDAASHEKWLLHTWSLSVEWQFYILYPVVILALKKFLPLRSLKLLLVFGTILGFILSVIATNKWPNPSYYLLPTRAWEMMMGGVAYVYPWNLSEKKKRVLEFLGLSLILGSYFFVTSSIPWPGHFAILPVLGAYFIIISNRQNSFITNNFIFQPLGKWSYSIYLWHWPIVVFIYSYGLDEATIAGILLSIFLGGISSKYIERISFKNYSSWLLFYQVKPLYMVVALIPISLFVYIENGINSSVRELTKSPESKYLNMYHHENYVTDSFLKEYRQECDFFDSFNYVEKSNGIDDSCFKLNNDSKYSALLWGDSHAQALSYGLRNNFPEMDILQVASSGCRPLIEKDNKTTGEFKKACDRSNEKAFETVISFNPDFVFLAQKNEHDLNDYLKIVKESRALGVKSRFVLIGPVPQWEPSLPKAIAMRHMDAKEKKFEDYSFVTELLDIDINLRERYSKSEIFYISLLDELCDGTECLAKVDNANTPIVWDYGHLTLEGSNYIVKNIIKPKIDIYLK